MGIRTIDLLVNGRQKVTCVRVVVSSVIDQHLVESNDSDLSLERWESQTGGERHLT